MGKFLIGKSKSMIPMNVLTYAKCILLLDTETITILKRGNIPYDISYIVYDMKNNRIVETGCMLNDFIYKNEELIKKAYYYSNVKNGYYDFKLSRDKKHYKIMKTKLFAIIAVFSLICFESSAVSPCKGKCRDGKGTYTFDDGEVYSGTFKEGKFEGKGTYKFKSGSVYEGDFKAGVREGKGKFTFPTGDVYEGEFKNGYPEGKGVYYFSTGDKYEGEFKAGKMDGNGTYTFASGTKQVGIFEEGDLVEEISIERPHKKK